MCTGWYDCSTDHFPSCIMLHAYSNAEMLSSANSTNRHMWLPYVEINIIPLRISIVSLRSKRRISELPLRVLCKCSNYWCNYAWCRSPALNGNSEIQHFECSDVIKTCDGIIFDFYMGLPHNYSFTLLGQLMVKFRMLYLVISVSLDTCMSYLESMAIQIAV